ncbi:MAG: phosphoribosylglycinamide formyltransferase [Candidatus Omnitrophica bacterium]|nr:phosphoribosylglycinamide formyltransferase [Candidatus Omnitrophota bacterium]
MNIAVFVSGTGSNLQALINAEKKKKLAGASLALVVCDKPGAFALERARKAGIETFVLETKGFDSREKYDAKIIEKLKEKHIELVALAGFMRILSERFVKEYEGRIMNVHPALLPAFKGAHGIKDAFDSGVKVTGVTMHFVTNELDSGPVILQKEVRIGAKDTLSSLEKKIHAVEHKLYPEAVRLFVKGKLKITDGKVNIQ